MSKSHNKVYSSPISGFIVSSSIYSRFPLLQIFLLITCLGSFLFLSRVIFALDCLTVRILPFFEGEKVLIEGFVNKGHPLDGIRRRDRIRSLFASSAASATVVLQIDQNKYPLTLDDEGGFSIAIPRWTGTGTLSLIDPVARQTIWQKKYHLPQTPNFLLVSDIDDTILVTEVTKKVLMVYNSLFKSLEKRQPVYGTPQIYRQLASESPLHGQPLIVYLTCSPAALARSIEEFLSKNCFPEGVLITKHTLLSDGTDPAVHKTKWLQRLKAIYPGLPFLLLGDSGEKDPEIYTDFLKKSACPRLGIIIRQLPGREALDKKRFSNLAAEAAKYKIPFFVWSTPGEFRSVLAKLGFQLE